MERVEEINKKFEERCLEGEKKAARVNEYIKELAQFIRDNHEIFDRIHEGAEKESHSTDENEEQPLNNVSK